MPLNLFPAFQFSRKKFFAIYYDIILLGNKKLVVLWKG